MQELICFKCGFRNNFGNKYCTNCGEKFQYSCPKCNSIVIPGIRFCSSCGAELAWDITPPPTPQEITVEKQEGIKLPDNMIETDTSERTSGPRRNILPFVIILVLIVVFIIVIFAADIFLKF